MAELPKVGDLIPVEMFHVSKTNVRFGEPFGDSEEDKNLVANLTGGKIIQAFKVRPEGDGYGVVVGRRRFLGKKEAGAKHFVVGVDCLVEEMSDEEAREASWVENLDFLRKQMDPITRANGLKGIVSSSPTSLRGVARRLGIPVSNLSEWMKVLELSPKMQDLLAKRLLTYSDGVMIARMKLDTELQDKLAEVLETRGIRAFKKLIRKKRLTKHTSAKKLVVAGKDYWKQLTRSLRDFANYWPDYCKLREREDVRNYHLSLEVTMPKDLNETYEPNGLEILSADEAPQICGPCGRDILAGDPFAEKDGIYYCSKCTKELSH